MPNYYLKSKACKLLISGDTPEQVATVVGVTPQTVRNWLQQHQKYQANRDELCLKRARALDLRQAGLKQTDIARIVGVSQPTVSMWLSAPELSSGLGQQGARSKHIRYMRELHHDGHTDDAIAVITGVDAATVARWLYA